MFFKNATFFTLPQSLSQSLRDALSGAIPPDLESFQASLAECVLKPVGPLELESRGFVSPLGEGNPALYHAIGSYVWLTIGSEKRMLPSSVIDRELQKKLNAIEQQEGRRPGARTRKRLKEDLVQELLPKAFVKPGRTDAYLDLDNGLLVVDTSSRKAAESVASEIRHALGSFPALPLSAEVAPRSILTGWIAGEPLPDGVSLGDECELKDALDGGAVVRCKNQELASDEIAKHLEAGKQVSRLALVSGEHVSFVFGDDLVLRKIKFLDGAVASLESTEREDLQAELDARFALQTAEVAGVFAVLEVAFKLSRRTD